MEDNMETEKGTLATMGTTSHGNVRAHFRTSKSSPSWLVMNKTTRRLQELVSRAVPALSEVQPILKLSILKTAQRCVCSSWKPL